MDEQEVKEVALVTNEPKAIGREIIHNPLNNQVTNFGFDETEIARLKVFFEQVIRSKKSGIESVADGLAIAMRAKDLRLPLSTCIEHIHIVQGKTGVDVHIIKALLIKGSVSWENISYYRALYEYTDGINVYNEDKLPIDCVKVKSADEAKVKYEAEQNGSNIYVYPVKYYQDFQGTVYKEYQFNDKFAIAISLAHANKLRTEGKFPVIRIPAVPIDYITEYKFTRNVGGRPMVTIGKFSYSDALQAGLFEKDTYKKFPKTMISHRAFIYGARDIADDLIMGCMSVEELKTINGMDVSNDDIIDVTDL